MKNTILYAAILPLSLASVSLAADLPEEGSRYVNADYGFHLRVPSFPKLGEEPVFELWAPPQDRRIAKLILTACKPTTRDAYLTAVATNESRGVAETIEKRLLTVGGSEAVTVESLIVLEGVKCHEYGIGVFPKDRGYLYVGFVAQESRYGEYAKEVRATIDSFQFLPLAQKVERGCSQYTNKQLGIAFRCPSLPKLKSNEYGIIAWFSAGLPVKVGAFPVPGVYVKIEPRTDLDAKIAEVKKQFTQNKGNWSLGDRIVIGDREKAFVRAAVDRLRVATLFVRDKDRNFEITAMHFADFKDSAAIAKEFDECLASFGFIEP